MLKIEDVKVGDELVCIDDNNKNFNVGDIYKVNHIDKNGIMLSGFHGYWLAGVLQCFKKKEQSQYEFDDLIDVARKAFDEGVLQGYAVENKLVKSLSIKFSDTKVLTWHLGDDDYSIPIGHIQSLYKEAFVIECEEDLKRVKDGAKVTLVNGNESYICALNDPLDSFCVMHSDYSLDIFTLKGATVEQERGRDDRS